MSDPQKVTNQKALRTDSGKTWLIVGAIIAGIGIVMLWAMRELPPLGAATAGLVTIVVLYLAMVAVRFGVENIRVRLALLAALTISIVIGFMVVGWTIILSS